MMKGRCQKGPEMVLNNLYIDDLIDSFSTEEKAKQVINEVDNILEYGGFKVKEWTISCKNKDHEMQIVKNEKVLGVAWNVKEVVLSFVVKLNFSPKVRKICGEPDLNLNVLHGNIPNVVTRKILLSQINGIYDPLGLLSPYTVRAKILMKTYGKLMENRLVGMILYPSI